MTYTRAKGEKGGLGTKEVGFSSAFFVTFLLSSSVAASNRTFTSSSTRTLSKLHCSNCLFFACSGELEALVVCKMATQMANACKADSCAWKSTVYCPLSLIVMVNAGMFSFLPYKKVGK